MLNGLNDDCVFKFFRIVYGCFLRVSVLGDSCVFMLFFFFNGNGFVQFKEFNCRGKYCNLVVDFERGFDSGFFGLEGSCILWGYEFFDILFFYYFEIKLCSVFL